MENLSVSIFCDDKNYSFVDLSHPELGNPGVGGTEYCFATLVYALKRFTDIEVTLYKTGNSTFPNCDSVIVVEDIYEAIEKTPSGGGYNIPLFR